MDVLYSYTFLVVAIGTFCLAVAAAVVGTLNVLQGQSLIGDAIGHATYPGVIVAYMLTLERTPLYLFLGALAAGAIAFGGIQWLRRHTHLALDAILAVVLSSAFGLGMVLKSYIQGHPAFSKATQSGLGTYLFGQAAYITERDVVLIAGASLLALALILVSYKEMRTYLFDPTYAVAIGLPVRRIQRLLLVSTLLLIATGLKVVGAILIASLLVMPAIAAMQWTHRYGRVLLLAGVLSGGCAVMGTYLSSLYTSLSTGPTIIVCLAVVAGASLAAGPHGVLANWVWRRREVE